MKAPSNTITPMMKHQASPACHASTAFFVASQVGSMTTKTTMNMCGTLGP